MLLDIEDLPDERNGRACGDRAHGMQRNGEAAELLSCCRPAQVKDGDHDHDKSVASAGAYLVPMGGDKQHYSACQQDGAKNQREVPCQPNRVERCAEWLFRSDSKVRMRLAISASRTPAVCHRFKSDSMSAMIVGQH